MSWNGIYTIFIRFGYWDLLSNLAPNKAQPKQLAHRPLLLWSWELWKDTHARHKAIPWHLEIQKKQHLRGQVVKAVVWNYLQPLIFHPSSFVCVNSERSETPRFMDLKWCFNRDFLEEKFSLLSHLLGWGCLMSLWFDHKNAIPNSN